MKNTVLFIDRIIFIIRICKFSSEDDIKGHMYTIYYFCHAIRIWTIIVWGIAKGGDYFDAVYVFCLFLFIVVDIGVYI